MSSPTTQPLTPSPGRPPQQGIADFVSAVRAHLDDLSPDEVTELTGGLEADLTEALESEGGTPAERVGDPAAYANELRSAAGLPPRAAGGDRRAAGISSRTSPFTDYRRAAGAVLRKVRADLEALPGWDAARDFLIVVRPAWWVLRAWIATVLVLMVISRSPHGLLPGGVFGVTLLLIAIVLSVQLGRRSPLPQRWQVIAVQLMNVFAVLMLVPAVAQTADPIYYGNSGSEQVVQPGLSMDGQPLTNVFPYDAQGNPLTGVQLYDQDGHPLRTAEDYRTYTVDAPDLNDSTEYQLLPGSAPGSPPSWNVFPLRRIRLNDDGTTPTAPPEAAPPPFRLVPPVIAAPSATPLVTSSPSPSPKSGR